MKKIWLMLAVIGCLLWTLAGAAGILSDGAYVPDGMSVSGGSGRVSITCPLLTVKDGAVTARLVFSSPNYTRVTLDGTAYPAQHEGDTSIFEVPVPLNRAFDVAGLTTAMSRPHDVVYTLFIRLAEAEEDGALPGLTWKSRMELSYAKCFSVDEYEGGFTLLRTEDGSRYLTVPEGASAPEGLDPAIIVLQKPLDRVYLASSSVMALLDRLDVLDSVRFSALKAEDWTVEHAAAAMESGRMLYAGKYSEPDYEMLLRENCGLAVENTMILHTPKVKEMLSLIGIPVLIDRSSYEPHPLGRLEWIRFYGVLFDREKEADAFFAEQKAAVEALSAMPSAGQTVAYFYIHTDGSAVVRGADDYIARMISLGGGVYAFPDMKEADRARASVSLTMEEFYHGAVDADCLIYNTSIDKTVRSLDDLLTRCPLLRDFKAVKEGRVFATGDDLYQATDRAAGLILDVRDMLDGREEGLTFLKKLE